MQIVLTVHTSGPIPHPEGVEPHGFRFSLGDRQQDSMGASAVFDAGLGSYVARVQRIDETGNPFGPQCTRVFSVTADRELAGRVPETLLAPADGPLYVTVAEGPDLAVQCQPA